MNYFEKWKEEIRPIPQPPEGYPHPYKRRFSPAAWSFVSFALPLVAVPLIIKGATKIGEVIKKKIDEKKEKEVGLNGK